MIKDIATSVAATGSAEADYELATFHVGLITEGKTVPEAKEKLKIRVRDLELAISKIVSKLDSNIIASSIKSSVSVQPVYTYGKNNKAKLTGHQASYTQSFKTDSMDKVSQIYDELTYIPEISADEPSYSMKNIEELNIQALEDAKTKVFNRFNNECVILGIDPVVYKIATWEVNYSDSNRGGSVGRSYALASSAPSVGSSSPIELHSGKATVTVNLRVGFNKG
jgi:uncharacterized protein YggE